MVKRGGTKRKIEIKKITEKNTLATCFSKRRDGLYSKAAQLCVASDAQIAILSTPASSNSNVSFFSFGHSSVEALVSAYLSGERLAPVSIMDSKEMREDLGVCFESCGLGLESWWEDQERFKNPQQIMEGIKSIESLLSKSKRFRTKDAINVVDQTLTIGDDFNDKTAERDQIMSTSNNFCDDASPPVAGHVDEWTDMDFDQLLNGVDETQTTDEEAHHQISENLCSNNYNAFVPESQTQEEVDHHQIVTVSENLCSNNNALGNMDDEQQLLDLDFEIFFEGISDQGLEEWSHMDLDQLIYFDVENQTQEEEGNHQIPENLCNNIHKALLPENQTQEEEDHRQIVATSENLCSNNNNALLPAGNMDDELLDLEIDLDFETIFKEMSDKELDEFAATFLLS